MRRADLAVALFARVQVVVQPIEPGFGQDLCVLVFHQARGQTHFDGVSAFDLFDELRELLGALDRRAAPREHHAVTRSSGARGFVCFFKDLFVALHRVFADRRFAVFVLRAVATVFGAQAVLHVVQHVDHDFAAEVLFANLEGGVEQCEQRDVFAFEDPARLFGCRSGAGEGG